MFQLWEKSDTNPETLGDFRNHRTTKNNRECFKCALVERLLVLATNRCQIRGKGQRQVTKGKDANIREESWSRKNKSSLSKKLADLHSALSTILREDQVVSWLSNHF